METQTIELGNHQSYRGKYVMASGASAARRLFLLHRIYGPAGRRLLLQAGLTPGMHVADFGCGVGAATRMLAEMTGPSGAVTAIDLSQPQLDQAIETCRSAGLTNVTFQVADACATGLPRNSFDLVYCRFLLLHLQDPSACLREMRDVLKPDGILVVEDADIASSGSVPPSVFSSGVDLFMRLGPARGLNYSLAKNLYHLVRDAGFADPQVEIHQPAACRGDTGKLLSWSIAEAGPALVSSGLTTERQFKRTVIEMQAAEQDPDLLVLAPRMYTVWARKAA